VRQSAAQLTTGYVAASVRLEILRGVGHFITDEVPEIVTAHLLGHFAAKPI